MRFVIFLQILNLIIPIPSPISMDQAFAATGSSESSSSTCKEYSSRDANSLNENEKKDWEKVCEHAKAQACKDCLKKPGADTAACSAKVDEAAGTLLSQCAAKDLYNTGIEWEIGTITAYSAAAVVCLGACIKPAASKACIVSGLGAGAADIAGVIELSKKGEEWTNLLMYSGPGFIGTAVGLKGGYNWARTAGKSSSNATKNSSTTTGNASKRDSMSCAMAALFAATAGAKGYLLHTYIENREETQQNIVKAFSEIQFSFSQSGPPLAGALTKTTSESTLQAGKTSAGGQSQAAPDVSDLVANFPDGKSSAATSGGMNKLWDKLPNKADIPKELDEMGTNLQDIANKIASGASVGDTIASSIPGLTDEGVEAFKQLDALAKSGELFASINPSTIMTSGGGRGGATKSDAALNPFFGMGMKDAGGPGTSTEASFEKSRGPSLALDPSNGDIWHSNWNGSIFQLVSLKMGQSRDRVDQLEWVTPLNRALMGLPRTPASTGANAKNSGILKSGGNIK